MKRKNKEYLPLYWCRNMREKLRKSIGENITAEELSDFVSSVRRYAKIENNTSACMKIMYEFGDRYPAFAEMMDSIAEVTDKRKAAYIWKEVIKDFDSVANVTMWAENKQVFQFDADFIGELLKTDNLSLNKNAWDFLPFRTFYADISADRKLCEEIAGEGIFITVEKAPVEYEWTAPEEETVKEEWHLHLCKVSRKYFFHDLMILPNITAMECGYPKEKTTVNVNDIIYENNKAVGIDTKHIAVNMKIYQLLITQILNYLSSAEPDICENEQTKATYKPKPKDTVKLKTEDRFSEIRKWDVGVRFGSAVRKWKSAEYSADTDGTADRKRKKTYRLRPHSRKAHWSHYWYGSGENKVRRPKWIAATFVNVGNRQGEAPAVIHKCL